MATTEKVSITIGREELRRARRISSRLGVSLSTFVTEAVRHRIDAQARKEAALAVLESFAPEDRASPEEMQQLLAQWQAPQESVDTAPSKRPTRGSRARRGRTRKSVR